MAKILIGNKIISKRTSNKFIKCCACSNHYNFIDNIFLSYRGKILICPVCGLKHLVNFTLFYGHKEPLIKLDELNLSVIDIGEEAITRSSNGFSSSGSTFVDKNHPANGTGTLNTIAFFVGTPLTSVEVATFFIVYGNNLSTRDTVYIGNVASGYQEKPVSLDVHAGDFIGFRWVGGSIKTDWTGGVGSWYGSGDRIPCTDLYFSYSATRAWSVHGIGETPPVFTSSARTGIYSFKTLK